MTFRKVALVCLALALASLLASPATAKTIHFGTGIHLWVLQCGPDANGQSTTAYVSASTCAVPPPPTCRCFQTTHDFPVNHPYPTRVVAGSDTDNPSEVTVIFDSVGAIQCGVSVAPPPEGHGTCGDFFVSVPVEEWDVDAELLNLIESLRPEMEADNGAPVEVLHYHFAQSAGEAGE